GGHHRTLGRAQYRMGPRLKLGRNDGLPGPAASVRRGSKCQGVLLSEKRVVIDLEVPASAEGNLVSGPHGEWRGPNLLIGRDPGRFDHQVAPAADIGVEHGCGRAQL